MRHDMHERLIDALRREEAALLSEFGGAAPADRLAALRAVLRLYDDTPPVGAQFDALLGETAQHPAADRVIILPGPPAEVA